MPRPLGLDGKLYVGTAGATANNECTVIKDCSMTLDPAEAELKIRGSRFASSSIAKIKITLSGDLVRDTSDPQYQTIRNAIFNSTPIAFKGTSSATGDGVDGDFVLVGGQTFGQPLEDFQTLSFTASLNTDLREPTLITGT